MKTGILGWLVVQFTKLHVIVWIIRFSSWDLQSTFWCFMYSTLITLYKFKQEYENISLII